MDRARDARHSHGKTEGQARRELTIFAVIALAVVGFGSSNGTAAGAGSGERLRV
ncbi:hypothetical protein [Streptomyces cyslabdanicus]|uniref:hypothetical protein n=1 Tax=Streptomyces cyslabdanicus TaxID=1470456 RepID=UPI0040441757